jgi:hypothetical protein
MCKEGIRVFSDYLDRSIDTEAEEEIGRRLCDLGTRAYYLHKRENTMDNSLAKFLKQQDYSVGMEDEEKTKEEYGALARIFHTFGCILMNKLTEHSLYVYPSEIECFKRALEGLGLNEKYVTYTPKASDGTIRIAVKVERKN